MKINLKPLMFSVFTAFTFSTSQAIQAMENSSREWNQNSSFWFGFSDTLLDKNTPPLGERGSLERNDCLENRVRGNSSNYVKSSLSSQEGIYQQATYPSNIIDLTQVTFNSPTSIEGVSNKRRVRDNLNEDNLSVSKKPRHENVDRILPDDIFFHIFHFPGSEGLGSTSRNLHRLFCSSNLMRTMYIDSEEKLQEILNSRNVSGNYELPSLPCITLCKKDGRFYGKEQQLGMVGYQFNLTGISNLLTIHSNLRTLNLDNIKMDINECVNLAEALKTNTRLRSLSLHNNCIGIEEGKILIEALKVNSTLTSLNFHKDGIEFDGSLSFNQDGAATYNDHPNRNEIKEAGGAVISDTLKINTALKSLNLWGNKVGSKGATLIGHALEVNSSLELLNLSNNKVLDEGAVAIGSSLTTNNYLTSLDLKWNEIGDEGVTTISSALATNTSLKTLDIGKNKFSLVGAQKIISALAINTSLSSLNLTQIKGSTNPLGQAGGKKIVEILKTNTSLTSLNLWGNKVGNYYQTRITKLLERNIKSSTELVNIALSQTKKSYMNKGPKRKLTWEQTKEIKDQFKAGANKTAIAKEFGISVATVNRYLNYDDEAPFFKGKRTEIPRSIRYVKEKKESGDTDNSEEDDSQKPIKKPRF